jgi:heme/copper-type cytochrome/quinol oxidase subunit 3
MTYVDTHSEVHGHDEGHHEPPEVVDGRQRMAIWIFIIGDVIVLSAMLFTYLYLRGLNVGGHWMSMWGYQGHSYAYYENLANGSGLPAPKLIHIKPMSPSFSWLVTGVTVLSAAVVVLAERTLRVGKSVKGFSFWSAIATIIALVSCVLSVEQLHHIHSIFQANNDAQVMAYTAYSSVMMVFIGSALVHLAILVFLGIGLTIRASRGVLSVEKWYQARLVRIFWVWVAVSAVIVSALTTTINKIH